LLRVPWADLIAVPRIPRCFSEVHRHTRIDIETLNSVLRLRAIKARAGRRHRTI